MPPKSPSPDATPSRLVPSRFRCHNLHSTIYERPWPTNPPAQILSSTPHTSARHPPIIQTRHLRVPRLALRVHVRKSLWLDQTPPYLRFPLEYTRCCVPKAVAASLRAFVLDRPLPQLSFASVQIRRD